MKIHFNYVIVIILDDFSFFYRFLKICWNNQPQSKWQDKLLKPLLDLVRLLLNYPLGMSSQIIISIILGQSLSALWMVINCLQLIFYWAMMTVYFPKITLTLFSFLGIANFEVEIFSSIFRLHFDINKAGGRESWDYRFRNQKVETTNILLNWSDIFFILILMIIYYSLIYLIVKLWIKSPDHK